MVSRCDCELLTSILVLKEIHDTHYKVEYWYWPSCDGARSTWWTYEYLRWQLHHCNCEEVILEKYTCYVSMNRWATPCQKKTCLSSWVPANNHPNSHAVKDQKRYRPPGVKTKKHEVTPTCCWTAVMNFKLWCLENRTAKCTRRGQRWAGSGMTGCLSV